MLVATEYVKRGYQVYWPAVRNGPTDFVVDKLGALLRVQVKTAWWNKSGPHRYLQCRVRSGGAGKFLPADGHYDLLLVVWSECVWELPAKLVTSSNICLLGSREGRPASPWEQYRWP